MKTTHKVFSTLTWSANSPSEYELLGYPQICARYNGANWQLNNITDVRFPSMETLSQVIEIIVKNFNARGYL